MLTFQLHLLSISFLPHFKNNPPAVVWSGLSLHCLAVGSAFVSFQEPELLHWKSKFNNALRIMCIFGADELVPLYHSTEIDCGRV